MTYSFDSSSLINPWRRSYPPDVFPSLWEDHLPRLIAGGSVRASWEVRRELERQDDELLQWALSHPDLFSEVSDEVQIVVSAILEDHPKLIDPRGRSGADPFVIAFAEVEQCAVVTEEKSRSLVNPRIPDVCAARGVRCLSILEVLREQGWVFR